MQCRFSLLLHLNNIGLNGKLKKSSCSFRWFCSCTSHCISHYRGKCAVSVVGKILLATYRFVIKSWKLDLLKSNVLCNAYKDQMCNKMNTSNIKLVFFLVSTCIWVAFAVSFFSILKDWKLIINSLGCEDLLKNDCAIDKNRAYFLIFESKKLFL